MANSPLDATPPAGAPPPPGDVPARHAPGEGLFGPVLQHALSSDLRHAAKLRQSFDVSERLPTGEASPGREPGKSDKAVASRRSKHKATKNNGAGGAPHAAGPAPPGSSTRADARTSSDSTKGGGDAEQSDASVAERPSDDGSAAVSGAEDGAQSQQQKIANANTGPLAAKSGATAQRTTATAVTEGSEELHVRQSRAAVDHASSEQLPSESAPDPIENKIVQEEGRIAAEATAAPTDEAAAAVATSDPAIDQEIEPSEGRAAPSGDSIDREASSELADAEAAGGSDPTHAPNGDVETGDQQESGASASSGAAAAQSGQAAAEPTVNDASDDGRRDKVEAKAGDDLEFERGDDASPSRHPRDRGLSSLERVAASRSLQPTAPAEQHRELTAVERGRFVQRVSSVIERGRLHDGTMRVRLSPPELGSMRIELAVRQGVLTATIEADTTQARNVLLDNLPALRDRLAEQEIRVERFEVEVRRDGQQQPHDRGEGRGDPDRRPLDNRPASSRNAKTPEPTALPPEGPSIGDAALDVRI